MAIPRLLTWAGRFRIAAARNAELRTTIATVMGGAALLSAASPAHAQALRVAEAALLIGAGAGLQTVNEGSSTADDQPAGESMPENRLLWHIPDAEIHRPEALALREAAALRNDRAAVTNFDRVVRRTDTIRRENQLPLSLEDALRRALENNYAIEIAHFSPAVETTRIVEAEAAFDAVFFTDVTKNVVDRPTGSQLTSGDADFLDVRSGISKLLPTGMQTTAYYGFQRNQIALTFQQINPEYISNIVLEMRQPFLRGFGIDQNRALIMISKNDRSISDLAFRRQVRDNLRQVEEVYWRLVQARRDVVITSRLLAGFEAIYEYLDARRDFDVIPVQLAATKADLEQSRAEFVRACANVFDAEDRLVALMNSAEVNLADNIELVPTDSPTLERIVVDRLAEVQTALDNRPEIKEDELRVANAKIAVGRADNAELPRLDVTFRYTIDGLADNADRSFDEVSRHNFVEYFVGVEFEVPIGNRGPRAASRRARLQHAQAVARLKGTFEEIILDANLAVRELSTTYDQMSPSFQSAEAREREIDSIVARAERMDINTLRNELNARQALATSRRALLSALVDYNIAIIDLERAKGTLLRHYSVVIPRAGE